jgi:hypothetical protein
MPEGVSASARPMQATAAVRAASVPSTPVPDTSVPAAPSGDANARVALTLEHGFKQGRLKVWVDEVLVLEKPLAAAGAKRVLFFTRSKGRVAEVLEVAPGQRMFRVEVEGDDDQHRGGQLTGLLRQHETRLLEVKVGGRIQLAWKS